MTSWAQTIMLHEIIMWPDQVDLALWPFALERSIYIWNNLPKPDSHLAPIEIYSLKKSNHKVLQHFHVWGCSTYVLDPKLQDGNNLPK